MSGLRAVGAGSPFVEATPGGGTTPAVLACDHGGNEIPPEYADLGLTPAEKADHIAWDPGAAALTRALAAALALTAVINRASRLLFDVNRAPDDPTAIRIISDRTIVAGNRGLTPAARAERRARFHEPYHEALAAALAALPGAPALIAVHSFTPVYRGARRAVEIGVLWDADDRIAAPLMAALRAAGFAVGDNAPYSGRDGWGGTIARHATPLGRPNVLIELRNDLLSDGAAVARACDALVVALRPILSDPALFTPWRADDARPERGRNC